MFDGFEQAKDEQARKRWFASGGISLVIYALVGVGVLFLARQTVSHATEEPPVDVTFRATIEPEAEPAPPPPPPPPPPKSKAPRAKKPGKPAPTQPTVIPEERPEEGDPGEGGPGEVIEEFGDGGEGASVLEAPPPPPPPPPKVERVPDPIDELDPSVKPASALGDNAAPVYPKEARRKGLEAEVILRVRISERGEVIGVEVLRGDEPFASAAIAAVKTWRYRPATVDGRPVAATRKVKIPFRISASRG